MKKRLLALLLALVMALGMLPTAFALDADEPAGAISAGAADAETLAEGETEEEAAEPEQPEAEEPAEEPEEPEQAGEEPAAEPEEAAVKEAEVAAFAADTSGVEAYLMGVRLQNGYYKTAAVNSSYLNMDDDTYSADVPTGWNNYLQYENGTLTVFGTVDAVYSGKDAVLRVESGTLTINGAGALSLIGTDTTALYVDNNNAEICIDFTPSTSGQQLSIHSRGAVAVSGDLTIDNAGTIWIESKPSLTPDENDVKLYDTIIGNVYINASNVSIMNTAGGSCVNGNITLANAKLMISSEPIGDTGAMSPVAAVSNCSLEMTNSSFWVKGSNNSWDKLTILDNAYEWYVGKSELDNEAFISSKTEKFTAQKANDHPFFWIRSGDKMEPSDTPAERKAELTAAYPIAASAGKPVTFHASVRLTGETLNVQDIDGYGWMFDYFEEGVQYSRYGIPYQTDLTGYITLETPAGGTWTITADGDTYQDDTILPLLISGTPETACDGELLRLTISGDILKSGKSLAVQPDEEAYWDIAAREEVDYDNIDSAEAFVKAIGGENYAWVNKDGDVVLIKDSYLEHDITMTGDFTVNLLYYSLCGTPFTDDITLHSKRGEQTFIGKGKNRARKIYGKIVVDGGDVTLQNLHASDIEVESGMFCANTVEADRVFVRGGIAKLSDLDLIYAQIEEGEAVFQNTKFEKIYATNLSVRGGKAVIEEGTELPCLAMVNGGELTINGGTFYGYEGCWLQQEGGTVNISGDGQFDGSMLITKGKLNIWGGVFTANNPGDTCLYQGGGNVTIENAALNAIATVNSEGVPMNQNGIYMDGGSLRVKNAQIDGTIVVNNRSEVELESSTVKTGTAVAIVQNGGTLNITDCEVSGRNVAMVVEDKNASATLTSGTLTGGAWGVWVSDGGSFTMLDGTVQGSQKGIWVSEARTKLIVKGGSVISDEVALYVEKGSSIQLSGGTFTGGLNAIFAENGTMKGWLASGCEMSGDAVPGGFDPNKASATDAGTVTIEPESNEAAERVIELIDAIGEVEPNDDCKNKIDNAQAAYDALSAAQQKKVTNYKTLVNARATYDKLMADLTYVEQANEVNDLMAQVPENTDEIEKDDLAAIERAEAAYNAVAKDKNVKKYLDNNLVKHLKSARKAYDKSVKSAQKVQAMIEKLPEDAGKLDVSKDRKSVEKANAALDKLTRAQRTFLEAGAEDKLAACTAQMTILTSCEKVIKDAQTAIKKLPAWNKIKATDESKVKAAEDAMAELENTAQEMGIQLTVGEGNEEKYSASTRAYYDFKDAAEDYRKAHLAPLADCEADSEHEQAIAEACAAYKNLGSDFPEANVTKNVQSFITKAEQAMLKNLEKLLNKNKKAALKVTKLIEKLPDPNASFTAKDVKAIDAAWKAYQALKSDAERSFVEGYDTLIACYYGAHPDQRPGVWSVIDCAYISFPKGEAVLNADVVDFEAKTTTSAVKKFSSTDLNEYYDDTDITIDASLDAVAAKNFAYELVVQLQALTYGENPQDFNSLYDHLFKITTDRDGVLSVKVGRYSNGAALNWAFGIHPYQLAQAKAEGKTVNLDDYTIKVVNGKPYLEITDDGQYSNASITPDKNDKDIALSSKTRFLVHNMDGTYSAYTGYKNVPSLIAHYAEVVFDADYTNELVAEVVYLTV